MSHEKIFEILSRENEITWQSIIYELIKTEQMNPWDIDVSLLSQKYLDIVKNLQETNFLLSGKVVLASAMLVKIKSSKFMDEEISHFDNLLYPPEEPLDTFDYFEQHERPRIEVPGLAVRSPQARKRRISVQDLMAALERALEVNKRRILRNNALLELSDMKVPEKEIDIGAMISSLLEKIKGIFGREGPATFSRVLPEKPTKKDKILTLFPLLVMECNSQIDLEQDEPFGEIRIMLKAS
jgi:segregation and condensation protein A